MEFGRNSRGEVSLGYLFKFGFGAFVVLCINTAFDYVSETIYTYKVETLVSSPLVRDVKQCVYDTIMDGSYLRLPSCSTRGISLATETSPVEVSTDGDITLKDRINDTEVSLKLTPSFRGNGQVIWSCSGEADKYLPDGCARRAD